MSQFKRTIFIINPAFQYKFSFFLCVIVVLSTVIYPLTIYDLFETVLMKQVGLSEEILKKRDELMLTLGLFQLAFLGMIFVMAIFISHKIAGPLYKLSMYLRNIRNGQNFDELYFRKGDNFQELATEVNQTFQYLSDQRKSDFEDLDEIASYVSNLSLVVPEDKKPVLEEIQSKLAQIKGRY